MTTKRSRIFRSSSLGEVGLYNKIQPIDSLQKPNWLKKPKPVQKQLERPIFVIGSPVRYSNNECPDVVDKRFGVLSPACNLCNKVFGEDDNVYMYSYFGVFCSVKCRDNQISDDTKNDKLPYTTTVSQTFLSLTKVAIPKMQKQVESEKIPTQVKKKPLIATSFKYV